MPPSPARTIPPDSISSLGANTLVYSDPFDDTTQWHTSAGPTGSVAYDNGSLSIAVTADGASMTSWHGLTEARPVARVEGTVTLTDASGSAGMMCGTSAGGPGFLYGSVASGAAGSTWALGQLLGGVEGHLAEGPLPTGIDLAHGGTIRVAVECASLADTSRIVIWVDGELAGDISTAPYLGLFDTAGLYAATPAAPFLATFDDVRVALGDVYVPVTEAGAVIDLLSRLPSEFRQACSGAFSTIGSGVLASVSCNLPGTVGRAEYYRYASSASMADAFASVIAGSGTDLSGEDCSVGPSQLSWSVEGQGSGQLACFPGAGGDVIAWTNDGSDILAIGQTSTGGFPELYQWWRGALPSN